MIRVRKDNPCPVCGRPNWCLVEEDGSAAICARISEGGKKVGTKDAGWLHKLVPDQKPVKRHRAKSKKRGPPPDFYRLTQQYLAKVSGYTVLSNTLGVSPKSLARLQMGWCATSKAYAFPMRDGANRIVGIRLRSSTGKYAVRGSRNALFWPVGVAADSKNLLFICEGPTDTAALLDLGFDAIGRASCNTGANYIKTMIARFNRQVVIVSDKDSPKDKPGGGVFYPGIEGARKLAKDIKSVVRSVRTIKPPHNKDMREWYRAGATAAKVMILVNNARFL